MNIQTKSTSMNTASNISKQIQIEHSKPTKDILVDFVIVYLFVPLWITLLACTLKYSREKYIWTQSILGDLLFTHLILIFLPFVSVAIPLSYLRHQASNQSHFLHPFRVETIEIFMEKTRGLPTPSILSWDVVISSAMIIFYCLLDPFQNHPLSEIPLFTLYSQSFVVLVLYDVGMYWQHRMLHHPKWYKYHKKHHEVKHTTATRVRHVEGVEFLMNALIIFLVPMIYQVCGTAMVREVCIAGFAFMLTQTYISHSDLYFVSSRWSLGLVWGDVTICHSNHHSKNDGNFGIVASLIWDWIYDTRYKPILKQSLK